MVNEQHINVLSSKSQEILTDELINGMWRSKNF